MTDLLKLTTHGSVAQITIANPPANVWTLESLNGLRDLVNQLNADPAIRALVLTGEGPKFFSAGADLKVFAEGGKAAGVDMAYAFGQAFETLAAFKGVSIAAINGYAMGGGLEVALACDIRIAEAHAQMALPEGAVGLLPCAGGTQWLAHAVGEGWAKRMILCGERINAETALRIGLVEEVVETGKALETALALAANVQKQSPDSVVACKSLIHAARAPSQKALPVERELFIKLFDAPNQAEGVNAFVQKRKPEWQ
ncbi:enoyl-CoA hydratase [Sinimarinibacterium sp. NLF-5-8]|uniref:enoyl-CoA hydratase n=1 Tax=Sinimarinibacterium sp. NLF-5-8 TaxID=2698684 RepID=UPI00137C0647|nr:enoyl-CoA hydratase [Sinimarinibacterium sp. NLF-5-8]QHS11188.1 enoyl-CoA hydratase [Sinimarinibacterium sp. NLF-5-8]